MSASRRLRPGRGARSVLGGIAATPDLLLLVVLDVPFAVPLTLGNAATLAAFPETVGLARMLGSEDGGRSPDVAAAAPGDDRAQPAGQSPGPGASSLRLACDTRGGVASSPSTRHGEGGQPHSWI